MPPLVSIAKGLTAAGCACTLLACGGGGGGDTGSGQFSLSTATLTFTASSPLGAAPAGIEIVGTASGVPSGSTLYVLIEPVGDVIDQVSELRVIDERRGGITIYPVTPRTLGSGRHSATLTIHACINSSNCASGELSGSPKTVQVTYDIGTSVERDTVTPSVVPAGANGSVILRGLGFGAVTDVRFGSQSAPSFTQRSDNEIEAQFPALAAGDHTITVEGSSPAFVSTLSAVTATPLPQGDWSYSGQVTKVARILIDDRRRAILAVVIAETDLSNNPGRILRYTANTTGWDAPTEVLINGLTDAVLAPGGDSLLALTERSIRELDPVTLAQSAEASAAGTIDYFGYMRRLVLANDGHAVIGSEYFGLGPTDVLVYSTANRTFTSLDGRWGSQINGTFSYAGVVRRPSLGVSRDGSRVILSSAGGYDQRVHEYSAATGALRVLPLEYIHAYNRDDSPALDGDGSRIIVSNASGSTIRDANYGVICTLPAEMSAGVLNAAGTRVWVVTPDSRLHTFDAATETNEGPCLVAGPSVDVPDPGLTYFGSPEPTEMVLDATESSLVVAGRTGVVVRTIN